MSCFDGCIDPCPPPCPPECNCTTNDITYNGVNDICYGITTNMKLTEVLNKLRVFSKNRLFDVAPSTSIITTPLPIVATNCNKTTKLDVRVSPQSGNALSVLSDGLFVDSVTGTDITVLDTPSVDLSLPSTVLTANIKRSATAGNTIVENSDGLYSTGSTADNGLTKTSSNIQLGGLLLHNTNLALNDYSFSINSNFGQIVNTKDSDITLTSPQLIITSGSLINQRKYTIVSNTGSDFTTAGAPNNTVGTVFNSNGGSPIWGTGSLELHGVIQQNAQYASSQITKGYHLLTAYATAASPNDFGLIRECSANNYEVQIFKNTIRANIAYITENQFYLKSNSTGIRISQIGVSCPTSNDLNINPPTANQYSSYTQWRNDPTGTITQGNMLTTSPYVTFAGITGVNAGSTRIGINNSLPTTGLDITSPAGASSFRIRQPFTPSSATDVGNSGDITWDSNYIYVCVATNTWKRTAITTW